MFGFKIISKERYESEQKTAKRLVNLNEELVKENVKIGLDIQSLREQNSKLRSINAKRKDENDALNEKLKKQKAEIKELKKEISSFRTKKSVKS